MFLKNISVSPLLQRFRKAARVVALARCLRAVATYCHVICTEIAEEPFSRGGKVDQPHLRQLHTLNCGAGVSQ